MISAVVNPESFVKIADRLSAEDFYNASHRIIWQAIGKLADRNRPIDALTVSEVLQGSGELDDAGGRGHLFI